jgi:hypothetical protein
MSGLRVSVTGKHGDGAGSVSDYHELPQDTAPTWAMTHSSAAVRAMPKNVRYLPRWAPRRLRNERTRDACYSRRPITIESHSSPLARRYCWARRPSSAKPHLRYSPIAAALCMNTSRQSLCSPWPRAHSIA